MSTASGIAAVTAVLKDLLINGLLDHDATAAMPEAVLMSGLRSVSADSRPTMGMTVLAGLSRQLGRKRRPP